MTVEVLKITGASPEIWARFAMGIEAETQYSGRGRRPKALGPRTHKRCPRCGETKSLDQYSLRKTGVPQSYCKQRKMQTFIGKLGVHGDRRTPRGWLGSGPSAALSIPTKASSLAGHRINATEKSG